MLIVTTDGLPGFEIRRVLGPVFGVAVHSDQGGGAAPASNSGTFRVPAAEQPGPGLAAARREAIQRLAEEAQRMGANAVVGMCFDNAFVAGGPGRGGHEVCAYGTAVVAEAAPAQQPGQHPYSQAVPQPHPSRPPVVARNLTIGLHGDGTH
ncbi:MULTISPECIES: YbjQ family protein [Thermomonospora]|uniref:Uncharacterized protein n=1 Tax=Thermomonospora curvata (strain ATCC 19995 / DSM 43183 / JCM 3096 / KCTC 9072 / NBRC 15933 / NCIMB 10081 / Henssen B9) TaxID=471852 RepID=D1A9Q0_THECD|nr:MULTISPECIES: heavy metal-binding domain-containing protein [Thermomonospora]ACY98736.1 protein of unknown function DUF74 [Thermomonospora curvata DSM 43183]PKK13855.1 MAG: hypothetical protein BUE48_015590 [Thermomonospora sp. CIF 1]